MTDFKDLVVIITGASSGIGEAVAKNMAAQGYRLMLAARREDRLKQLQQTIQNAGGKAEYAVTDVSSQAQVQAMVDKAMEHFGQVDVIFNNAGLMPLSLLEKNKVDEWDRMVDVNIKGVLYGISAVLPIMLQQNRGHIINVASVAGHITFPGGAVYCATKHAVIALSEGLREELCEKGVRVTVISPGAVDTELPNHITDSLAIEGAKVSYGRAISADTIAEAVRYAIQQPPEVSINEILLRPTTQPL